MLMIVLPGVIYETYHRLANSENIGASVRIGIETRIMIF